MGYQLPGGRSQHEGYCWTRSRLIQHLENALIIIADEIEEGTTGYLIERALDEARSRLFMPIPREPG
jgi:hypothetical protein